jgi:hypothetical protein
VCGRSFRFVSLCVAMSWTDELTALRTHTQIQTHKHTHAHTQPHGDAHTHPHTRTHTHTHSERVSEWMQAVLSCSDVAVTMGLDGWIPGDLASARRALIHTRLLHVTDQPAGETHRHTQPRPHMHARMHARTHARTQVYSSFVYSSFSNVRRQRNS